MVAQKSVTVVPSLPYSSRENAKICSPGVGQVLDLEASLCDIINVSWMKIKGVMRRKMFSYLFFCSFSLLVVQGQVEVCAVLQDTQSIQEKAEYYVLLKGSHIHHVTKAQRKEKCHLLSFIIPGRSCGPIINKQSPVKAHYIYSDLQNYWLLHENKQKVVYKKNNTCNK